MIKGTDFTGITVSYIVIDKDKGLLSTLRSNKCRDERGKRDLGGGGLKFNEKLIDGLKREMKEELNIDDTQYKVHFLGHRELFRNHEGKPTHWISFEYLIILNSGTITQNMEPDKHEEIRFFPFDDLPSPKTTHSQYYMILSEFKEHIKQISGIDIIIPSHYQTS